MDTKKQAITDAKKIRKLGMKKANLKEQLLQIEDESKKKGQKISKKLQEIEIRDQEIKEKRLNVDNINK